MMVKPNPFVLLYPPTIWMRPILYLYRRLNEPPIAGDVPDAVDRREGR